jgi:hypothetical protein
MEIFKKMGKLNVQFVGEEHQQRRSKGETNQYMPFSNKALNALNAGKAPIGQFVIIIPLPDLLKN